MQGEEFDELVSFFDQMARTKWLEQVHNRLKEKSGDWDGKSVLDVGCGTGRLLLKGAKEAERVVGVDLSTEMVKASIQNFFFHDLSGKSEFIAADACHLPLADHSFQVALSTCVLFLLPNPEEGIKEINRVLCEDGTLAMLNPSMKMNQLAAREFAKEQNISGFEMTALLKWANVSTKRHRYHAEDLTQILKSYSFHSIMHEEVMDGLALITTAKK